MRESSPSGLEAGEKSPEKRLEQMYARVAREHLDEVLGEKEWRAYGLDSIDTGIQPSQEFSWIVSVRPSSKGKTYRLIEVEFFHDGYNSGGSEVTVEDSSMAYSDREKLESAHEQLRNQVKQAQEREQIERDRISEKALELLSHVTRVHLDQILGKKEWDAYGLGAIYEPPQDFEWCVVVLPREGEETRLLQMRIFSSGLLWDINEYVSSDTTLPLSDPSRLEVIEENARAAARAQHEQEQRILQQEEAKYTRERGFPSGGYTVTALFTDRRGIAQTQTIASNNRFMVEMKESRDRVQQRIESEVSMEGLHNFGLDTSPEEYAQQGAPVHVVMRNADGVEVSFDMRVNGSGHLVKKSKG